MKNRDYFVHLIRIAKADDVISNPELELLHRIGKTLDFTVPEIDNLIETTDRSDYNPPPELSQRFEQLYGVVKMTLADGMIDKKEMRIVSSFAAKSNFREDEIPHLLVLLISGIKQGKTAEELFDVYKKERKS